MILLRAGVINFKQKNEVDIKLSIDSVEVKKDAPNTYLFVKGTMNLSYDNTKYLGVSLYGYCLGADGEKYIISGPADGRALFHNDDNNNLTLTENGDKKIEYPDGTTKSWSEVDWNNVEIKYCKIDKMKAFYNGQGASGIETELNVENVVDVESKFMS